MADYLINNYFDEEKLEKKAIREGFGIGIVAVGDTNSDVVVLNADLPGSLKINEFAKKFPERYFQVGVAEQNMAGIGHGLAQYGKTPFISSFAAFSPGLNYSQIRLAAISRVNLKIVGSHYGLNTGSDGATAQMLEDVAMMKTLPGMVILNPCDFVQAIQATKAISEYSGIGYLRVTREKFPVFIDPKSDFKIGKAQKFFDGNDLTVISTGSMVYEALSTCYALRDEYKFDFLNIHTIKPLDEKAILESAKKTGKVIVIEEHNIIGGLGESVASLLSKHYPVPLEIIGVEDTFGESGNHRDLWKKYGLDRDSFSAKIKSFVNI